MENFPNEKRILSSVRAMSHYSTGEIAAYEESEKCPKGGRHTWIVNESDSDDLSPLDGLPVSKECSKCGTVRT